MPRARSERSGCHEDRGGRQIRLTGGIADGDGDFEAQTGAGSGLPQGRLELTKGLLDERQVRRIRPQEAHITPPGFDEPAHVLILVHTEDVGADDLPGAQRVEQDLAQEVAPAHRSTGLVIGIAAAMPGWLLAATRGTLRP